ncbi:MAG: hypothetical protein OXI64_10645 [Defluviicoccus sp.]|nr:hypothetical protein [Defluviicoccus sp.]
MTDESLAAAIRADTTDAVRLRPVVEAAVERYAPDARDAMKNEAGIRMAGYLLDQPPAPTGDMHAAAMRNSGAMALLNPYKIRRGGSIG